MKEKIKCSECGTELVDCRGMTFDTDEGTKHRDFVGKACSNCNIVKFMVEGELHDGLPKLDKELK